jgi:hypothetical protein
MKAGVFRAVSGSGQRFACAAEWASSLADLVPTENQSAKNSEKKSRSREIRVFHRRSATQISRATHHALAKSDRLLASMHPLQLQTLRALRHSSARSKLTIRLISALYRE